MLGKYVYISLLIYTILDFEINKSPSISLKIIFFPGSLDQS